jgi:hypothetical protein
MLKVARLSLLSSASPTWPAISWNRQQPRQQADLGIFQPKSGSWVIATMGRIGAFDGHEHNTFDAFTSPGG